MEWTTDTLLDGAVFEYTCAGDVYPERLMEMMRASAAQPEHAKSRAYLVDASAVSMAHLSYKDLWAFSEKRNEMRESFEDDRITAIYAPSPLIYGLVQIIAAFDRSPMRVFGDRSEAIAWLDEQLCLHPVSGQQSL